MNGWLQTRRGFAALLAASLAAPRWAWAGENQTGSRIQAPTAPPAAAGDYTPPSTLRAVADLYDRMSVPVSVNGKGPFPFVVDTGANNSVIADGLAQELGLTIGPPRELHGVAGVDYAGSVIAPTLQIGDRVLHNVTLYVLPAAAIGGPGLLGVDALEGQRLVLDFKNGEMRIEPSVRVRMTSRDVVLKAKRRSGQLTLVDAELSGVPVVAFLDSGAQSTIGNLELQRRAEARNTRSVWLPVPILSATGQTISGQVASVPMLRIGGLSVDRLPMLFADLHTFKLWDLNKAPAILLGVDILSRFEQVSLDFAKDEVRFRLPPGVRPPPSDPSLHSVSGAAG